MKQTFSINEAQITVGSFFLTLLHAATNTHILHLQSRSYSEHQALGSFYEELVELTDGLIESCQGKRGIVQYPVEYTKPADTGLLELTNLSAYITVNRLVIGNDSELQNEVDTIMNLINSTIYKLTFLK
jgi:hypothetical protein